MKIDGKIPVLFIPALLAVFLCLGSSLVLSDNSRYDPVQPKFLSLIDQLSLFTMEGYQNPQVMGIKDVFRHEWTMTSDDLSQYSVPQAPPEALSISVTMIVEAGRDSFCILNGKRMNPGEKTDSFRVTSIGKDHVTITYNNGNREIHHVKAY
jgi:hypothetical protein